MWVWHSWLGDSQGDMIKCFAELTITVLIHIMTLYKSIIDKTIQLHIAVIDRALSGAACPCDVKFFQKNHVHMIKFNS